MKIKDKNGKEWPVDFDLGTLDQIKEDLGIDLLNLPLHPEQYQEIFNDTRTCCDLIYAMVETDLERRDFLKLITKPVLEKIRTELQIELINFSPEGQRSELLELARKSGDCRKQILQQTVSQLEQRVQEVLPEVLDQTFNEEMEKLRKRSETSGS